MLVFRPNFTDAQLPPHHLLPDLHPFFKDHIFQDLYAFAYKHGDNYVAFSSNLNMPGFSEAPDNETLEEWLKRRFFATDIHSALYPPGHFYARMWRPPGYLPRKLLIPNLGVLTQSALSLELLVERMREIFKSVEPTRNNLKTFGHRIREILLLACMEVEASWAGILREHEYIKDRYTTNDYVKLLAPMCLADYQVRLRWYPEFPSFKPFGHWNPTQPTKSLTWYDAYNATKHDRETNLHKATLAYAVRAVGASAVMFHAQFGMNKDDLLTKSIYSTFEVNLVAQRPERSYVPCGIHGISSIDWTPAKYNFSNSRGT